MLTQFPIRLLAFCLAALPLTANAASCLRGVNLAGAEFGDPGPPHGKGYIYPSEATLDWAARQGMTAIRLPFLWERLQPQLFGAFDPDELARLQITVAAANSRGLSVILDLHNYAAYRGDRLGTGALTKEAFVDVWRRLAPVFAGNDQVVFGLMNEPVEVSAQDWFNAAQAGLQALRESGAGQLVLVPGTHWSGASHWFDPEEGGSNADNFKRFADSHNRFAFEFHQYMDANFSGTQATCPRAKDAVQALQEVTGWMRQHGFTGFLGEFGGSASPDCLEALKEVAGVLQENRDVWIGWTAWAAGEWWGDYALSLQPDGDTNTPQLEVLKPYFSTASVQCGPKAGK